MGHGLESGLGLSQPLTKLCSVNKLFNESMMMKFKWFEHQETECKQQEVTLC